MFVAALFPFSASEADSKGALCFVLITSRVVWTFRGWRRARVAGDRRQRLSRRLPPRRLLRLVFSANGNETTRTRV